MFGQRGTPAADAEPVRSCSGRIARRADDVACEVVNDIDGKRTVSEIRDAVSAEFSPVDVKVIAEDLELLARIGAISLGG
jgi:hypothetical protein